MKLLNLVLTTIKFTSLATLNCPGCNILYTLLIHSNKSNINGYWSFKYTMFVINLYGFAIKTSVGFYLKLDDENRIDEDWMVCLNGK